MKNRYLVFSLIIIVSYSSPIKGIYKQADESSLAATICATTCAALATSYAYTHVGSSTTTKLVISSGLALLSSALGWKLGRKIIPDKAACIEKALQHIDDHLLKKCNTLSNQGLIDAINEYYSISSSHQTLTAYANLTLSKVALTVAYTYAQELNDRLEEQPVVEIKTKLEQINRILKELENQPNWLESQEDKDTLRKCSRAILRLNRRKEWIEWIEYASKFGIHIPLSWFLDENED